MPGGDRTGPRGRGPRTGRGLGPCAGYSTPGYMKGGPGLGLGGGGGMGRFRNSLGRVRALRRFRRRSGAGL